MLCNSLKLGLPINGLNMWTYVNIGNFGFTPWMRDSRAKEIKESFNAESATNELSTKNRSLDQHVESA